MDKVSVIMPAHQAEGVIVRAVKSLIAQTYPHWELLLVSDDGRDYRAVLAAAGIQDSRIRFLHTPAPHSGPGAARNVALAQAGGDFIAPLDADDLYYPERLEKLVPLSEHYGMAGDNVLVVDDENDHPIGRLYEESNTVHWLGSDEYVQIATPMIFVFRRDVITAPWDEDIHQGGDTLFNLRGIEMAERVPLCNLVLHEHRIRADALGQTPDAHQLAEQSFIRSLEKLEENGLNFNTIDYIEKVRRMLVKQRELNRQYTAARQHGQCRNFQEFLCLRGKLLPGTLKAAQ